MGGGGGFSDAEGLNTGALRRKLLLKHVDAASIGMLFLTCG